MSLAVIENNCIFQCGHCDTFLGTMLELMDKQIASKHHCLMKCKSIELNCATKRVYGNFGETDPQDSKIENSTDSCESTAASASRPISDCTATGASTPTTASTATSASRVISACTATGASTAVSACAASTSSMSTSSSMPTDFSIDTDSACMVSENVGNESKCTWSHEAIKLLIHSYNDNKDKFDSPSYTKKKVWEIISESLTKKGIAKGPTKCDEKWRNLKKTYDKIRSERNQTGNHPVHWKYFEDFQEIYFRDPYFQPVASVSSTGMVKHSDRSGSRILSNRSKNLSPGEKPRKRALTPLDIEIRKQKRHDEKMDLKREMFQWMKENFGRK